MKLQADPISDIKELQKIMIDLKPDAVYCR